jgi:ubiquinone biosynthesis protein COQ9
MTARSKTAKGGAKRGRAKSPDAKHAVLAAALVHIPFDGFTDSVLARAATDIGVSRMELMRLFPEGPLSLVEVFSEWTDAEMVRELAKHNLASLKIRDRIALAVKTRIAVLKPYKEAARRAAAFLSLPPHAAVGLKLLYRTVDAVWRAIGDTSTDFNFYSKRAILGAVYSATLLRWFSDTNANQQQTEDFLRRRIDGVMRFEQFKAQVRKRASALPSLLDIFNPERRGTAPDRARAKRG